MRNDGREDVWLSKIRSILGGEKAKLRGEKCRTFALVQSNVKDETAS